MKVRLLIAPYHLGRRGVDVGAGPLRLAAADAAGALSRGVVDSVQSTDVAFERPPGADDAEALMGSVAAVADHVARAVRDGELPIVLAGNCFTSIGALAVTGTPDTTVVWFDAHGDFNTPQTSITGFLDGMALSAAVGDCCEEMLASLNEFQAIASDRVVLAGTRALDPAEQSRVESSRIRHLPAAGLVEAGLPDLGSARVHVHLDLDVLDASLGPVNRYGTPAGGISPGRLLELIDAVLEDAELVSMTLSAYDPAVDSGGVCAVALRVLERVAAGAAAARR
jgi:arginase